MSKERQSSEEMFDSLVKNAIDFLKRSIEELEDNPKYSVINFFSAIELFLKARLMLEHWALIITKSEQANYQKFLEGNFHSVSMEDALKRLSNIANEDLSKTERECFNQIREHRNKLVHFFHPDYTNTPNINTLQSVVAEQCKGWYYLHKLLSVRWSDHFNKYTPAIEEVDQLMHERREFLRAKFELLLPTIEEEKKNGATFTVCFACGFESCKEQEVQSPLTNINCLVCEISMTTIKAKCPNCGKPIYVQELGEGECAYCHEEIDFGNLTSQFDNRSMSDRLIEEALAYCSECEHTEEPTVTQLGDKWLCLYCHTIHEDTGNCEWCSSFVTGNLEDSSWSGCVMCEGRQGHGFDE